MVISPSLGLANIFIEASMEIEYPNSLNRLFTFDLNHIKLVPFHFFKFFINGRLFFLFYLNRRQFFRVENRLLLYWLRWLYRNFS